MAFGQSAGPAATHRQVKDLLELLQNIGYDDFRDARGPMGFSQRQAGGKFTAEEATELIDQLQAAEYEAEQGAQPEPEPKKKVDKAAKKSAKPDKATVSPEVLSEMERAVRTASTKSLVLEVRRRGWTVTKPK